MPQLGLFDEPEELPEAARRLAPKLQTLADEGVFFGTSSWKYPGWVGSMYSQSRYVVRGKFSQRKFDDECLSEYARTFSLVGGDFSFYQFPSDDYWARLFGESPSSLRFALKAPEDVTVAKWPSHARYGSRAGEPNPEFLNPKVLQTHFLRKLLPYRDRVAVVMIEFGTMAKSVAGGLPGFLELLEPFLHGLGQEIRLAIEIRNPEYLTEEYLQLLSKHNVAHIFNAWTRMPTLDQQVALPGIVTADFLVSRALLTKGRAYDDAVQKFEPYRQVQEPNPTARDGLFTLGEMARRRKKPAFLLVNNRLEGHAPGTIEAVADQLLAI